MNDNLQNNRLALESLFDHEFYHVGQEAQNADEGRYKQGQGAPEPKDAGTGSGTTKNDIATMTKPCMVFPSGDDPSSQKNLLELWRKILAAVQLTPNSINTVELEPGISVDHLMEGHSGRPLIFWTGEDKVPELEGFGAYEIHENEDIAIVIVDRLSTIAGNRDLKMRLWSVLQEMDFNPGG